jgi:hypothetical protein
MPRKAFYAWQSDSDESTNWHFIAEALKQSIGRLNADLDIEESEAEIALDRDTHGEPGMPAVADTVLRKISEAAVFVGDLTLVGKIERADRKPKYLPNANVSIEFGFAAGTIGFERMVCVFNDACGVGPENLPFDLVHRKHPILYHLAPDASDAQRKIAMDGLIDNLVDELRVIVTRLGLGATQDPLAHAAVPLNHFSFIGESPRIAQTKSRDADGVENDNVFWYNNPLAWLRLIPAADMNLSRSQLRALLAAVKPSLQPFGDAPRNQLVYNEPGAVVIGYDEFLPTEAMEITQVFRTGEIFGMNRRLIEPERTKPAPTYLIRWPTVESQFRSKFEHYVAFARDVLQAPLPLTVVAGLASVYDAKFTRQKENWFANAPAETRCLKGNIAWQFQITQWDEAATQLLDPFFLEILDECNQA